LGQARTEIFLQLGLDRKFTDLSRRAKSVLGAKVRHEVSFDTDPNSLHFRRSVIGVIVDTAKAAPEEGTTMVVSRLRIVASL